MLAVLVCWQHEEAQGSEDDAEAEDSNEDAARTRGQAEEGGEAQDWRVEDPLPEVVAYAGRPHLEHDEPDAYALRRLKQSTRSANSPVFTVQLSRTTSCQNTCRVVRTGVRSARWLGANRISMLEGVVMDVEEYKLAQKQPTPGPWEIYLCGNQEPDQACGIRTRAVECQPVHDMVVSDTNREECCHMMKLADAELIVLLHNTVTMPVLTVKGDLPPEQWKEFRERYMKERSTTSRAIIMDSHRQSCRNPECGGCGVIMGGDIEYSTSKPVNVGRSEDFIPNLGISTPFRIEDQPPPKATTLRPCWEMVIDDVLDTAVPDGIAMTIVDRVITDMRERDAVGRQRYGVPLTADNGRDQLVDAYQEGLDQSVYMRAFIEENADNDRLFAHISMQTVRRLYERHLQDMIVLRDLIETREVARGAG